MPGLSVAVVMTGLADALIAPLFIRDRRINLGLLAPHCVVNLTPALIAVDQAPATADRTTARPGRCRRTTRRLS